MKTLNFLLAMVLRLPLVQSKINRKHIVQTFNPVRYESSNSTPMQVGNGNFAFGVDVTGLQTFLPYATMSSWGWHNFSLPTAAGQTETTDFTGLDWMTHGRLVNYDQPNPAEPLISNWLIQNPQRINLGSIGFWFGNDSTITEPNLSEKLQTLDLYSGIITSNFTIHGSKVTVTTSADPDSDTVAIQVESDLLKSNQLSVFFDYPYPDVLKFDAPFVGVWNNVSLHTTSLQQGKSQARITHNMDTTTYFTNIQWDGSASITGPLPSSHRYILSLNDNSSSKLSLTVNYSPTSNVSQNIDAKAISSTSTDWWCSYWETGAFISLPTSNPNATELQRRTILSQYLLAVNEAGNDPPQESGLVNNGWYGKFHLEMVFWHLAHWRRWGKPSFLERSVPGVYNRFLATSLERGRDQGYEGARWGKMSDPSGRSAPGEINSLLIWQQPHPFYFAELEWREKSTRETLEKWDEILTRSAEFMVSYAWWDDTTYVYDLGPPMYPSSENTNPNVTINPTFELAYWYFGLSIAIQWKQRQNIPYPPSWLHVQQNLAPLPITNNTYPIYQSIPNMWTDPTTVTDHPSMTAIFGLLPPPPSLNLTVMKNTASLISQVWDFSNLYGWDWPMMAMNAARLGNIDQAVGYLLNTNFQFDDVGMPVGGPVVDTPYFPGSSSFLFAMAFLAGGWDGDEGVERWPVIWEVEAEGFSRGL